LPTGGELVELIDDTFEAIVQDTRCFKVLPLLAHDERPPEAGFAGREAHHERP